MNLTKDDLHWFESAFAAWECNDFEGVIEGLESALSYFMPERPSPSEAMRQAADRIYNSVPPDDAAALHIADSIVRYLKLPPAEYPCAYEGHAAAT